MRYYNNADQAGTATIGAAAAITGAYAACEAILNGDPETAYGSLAAAAFGGAALASSVEELLEE